MNIKLSPLMLFLLLLIVLVISITFGNMFNLEGFISFGYSNNSMDDMQIPQYSSAYVNKLYDNVFYDPKNGNLIEVDGITYGNAVTGNTVSKLYVTARADPNQTYQYDVVNVTTSTVDISTRNNTASSYMSFMYPTQGANTDKYSVFYIPYGNDTLIHIINNTTKINVGSFGYINGSIAKNPITSTISLGTYSIDNDSNNDKMIEETYYGSSNKVYQISKYVRYDISNARLIVKTSTTSNELTIYDRYGSSTNVTTTGYSGSQNGVSSVSLHSWVATDSLANQMILYIGFGKKTVVALIKYTTRFELVNIRRFDSTGVYNGHGTLIPTSALMSGSTISTYSTNNTSSTSTTSSTSSTSGTSGASSTSGIDLSGNDLTDFFKLYSLWKSNPNNEYSQDYVLKSSIVPPVCPSCPSCPSSCNKDGVCTNCGGQGGSGTLSSNGNTTLKIDTRTNIPGAVASLGGTVGDVANKALDTTGDVVDEAGNLVKGAVTGTVGLAKDAVTGTVGLAKDAVSGTVGLLKDAGSGVKDVLTSRPAQINSAASTSGSGTTRAENETQPYGGKAYGSSSYGGSGATNYNYYGAIPEKRSNFIPITSDFSAFGK
jgi:hypothetical protein